MIDMERKWLFSDHLPQVPPVDTLNGPPEPTASNAPPDEEGGMKAEHSVFGPTQRRGGPGHRRHNRGIGPRRGGGSRHQPGQAAAVTERLDKLGLSTAHTHGTVTEQELADLHHPAQEHTEPRDPVTVRGFHPDGRMDTKHTADSVGSHAPPGRRRGPHRLFRQPSRNRGGPGNHHYRGARFHSGHSRGFQQPFEEMARGREGALWQRAAGGPVNQLTHRNDVHCSVLVCSFSLQQHAPQKSTLNGLDGIQYVTITKQKLKILWITPCLYFLFPTHPPSRVVFSHRNWLLWSDRFIFEVSHNKSQIKFMTLTWRCLIKLVILLLR